MTVTKKFGEEYDIELNSLELGVVENLDITIGSAYCKKAKETMYEIRRDKLATVNLRIENTTLTSLELTQLTRWVNGEISYHNVTITNSNVNGLNEALTLNGLLGDSYRVEFFETKIEELHPVYTGHLGVIDLTKGTGYLTVDKINYGRFDIYDRCKMLILPKVKEHYIDEINHSPVTHKRCDIFVFVINRNVTQNKGLLEENIKSSINLLITDRIKVIFD